MNTLTRTLTAIVLACALSPVPAQEAKTAQPQDAPPMAQMQRMQENMQAMRKLMTQIQATSDPAARQKLLQQHRELMQSQMQLMKGGMGPMSDDCGAMGKGPDHRPMRMMMMDQMMEQMMQREDATAAPEKKPVK